MHLHWLADELSLKILRIKSAYDISKSGIATWLWMQTISNTEQIQKQKEKVFMKELQAKSK